MSTDKSVQHWKTGQGVPRPLSDGFRIRQLLAGSENRRQPYKPLDKLI